MHPYSTLRKSASIGPLVDFHRDAAESARQMILQVEAPDDDKKTASTTIKQHEGREGITRVELKAKWHGVVDALKRDGVTVTNPDHALEGALTIRCAGSPLRSLSSL